MPPKAKQAAVLPPVDEKLGTLLEEMQALLGLLPVPLVGGDDDGQGTGPGGLPDDEAVEASVDNMPV